MSVLLGIGVARVARAQGAPRWELRTAIGAVHAFGGRGAAFDMALGAELGGHFLHARNSVSALLRFGWPPQTASVSRSLTTVAVSWRSAFPIGAGALSPYAQLDAGATASRIPTPDAVLFGAATPTTTGANTVGTVWGPTLSTGGGMLLSVGSHVDLDLGGGFTFQHIYAENSTPFYHADIGVVLHE